MLSMPLSWRSLMPRGSEMKHVRKCSRNTSARGATEGVPVVGVEAGVAQRRGVLAEGQGVAAVGCNAADLLGAGFGVPDDGEGHWDEPAGVGGAPVLDVPVVVGLDQGPGETG